MANYTDAIVCPQCGLTGNVRKKIKDGPNSLHMVYCENERCSWFDTPWNVTVRPDGSVPDPQIHMGQKHYKVSKSDVERARQISEEYAAKLLEQSLKGGEARGNGR